MLEGKKEKERKGGKERRMEEGRNEEREINRGISEELRGLVGGCFRFIILLLLKKTEGKLTKFNRATSSWVSVG